MILVGLTGGIGSGKTTVAQIFNGLGVPVYNADKEAKLLMKNSTELRAKLTDIFGKNAYVDGELNRKFLSERIFANKDLLTKMNSLVHPAVEEHFNNWLQKQNTAYILKEAAIIFEHNKQNEYDFIITVIADKEERIKRTMQRDSRNRESVVNIIDNQLPDSEKIKKSDFVITNHELAQTTKQVAEIHKMLMEKASNKS